MDLFNVLTDEDKCKSIVKYFMLNFLKQPFNYRQTIAHNKYQLVLEYSCTSRGPNYVVEILKMTSGMFTPGQFSPATQQRMGFRYFQDRDGVLSLGHAEWPEVLDVLEDFLVKQCCVVGPLQEIIAEKTKDATEASQEIIIGDATLYGTVEYNSKEGYSLYLAGGDPSRPSEKIIMKSMDASKDGVQSGLVRGNLKELAGKIFDIHKDICKQPKRVE